MSDDQVTKKRRAGEGASVQDAAKKWAAEFAELEESDQFTYLEALASSKDGGDSALTPMHAQFITGLVGFGESDEIGRAHV